MFYRLILLITHYSLFLLSVSSQTESWKKLENDSYQISCPQGWFEAEVAEEYKAFGVQFLLSSGAENKKDDFYENANIVTEKAPLTLQKYAAAGLDILEKSAKKLKMMSSGFSSNSTGEYYFQEYTSDLDGKMMYAYQCVWKKEETFYVLTFTSVKKKYKKYQKDFKAMATTLVIK